MRKMVGEQMLVRIVPLIDHQARREFLRATTTVIRPAPIDELLARVGPFFRMWLMAAKSVLQDYASGTLDTHKISALDDSLQASLLKEARKAWMQLYNFNDPWIAEAAIKTLCVHMLRRSARSREWYMHPIKSPDLKNFSPRRDDELDDDYLNRCDQEFRESRKEYVKLVRYQAGERHLHEVPAKWTAARFAGKTFSAIANRDNRDRKTVEKAVRHFADYAGLTLP
jgi:hypothetical protein